MPKLSHSQCGTLTPSYTVDLTGSPSGTYVSPATVREDTCCGGLIAGKCIKFTITLDPGAMGINFGIASGSTPPGSLFYQINCDTNVYANGTPVCLNGAGPHILTFCKPGNNINTYSITSIPAPNLPDSVLVRNSCTQTLTINGLSVPTITWTSVPSNTLYNSFLSCTTNCSVTVVTPTGTNLPTFIDYEVAGWGLSPCQSQFYRDTVRVYLYNTLAAPINSTTICFGSTTAVISPTPTGGLAPYTYTWSTGSNNSSITVGQGTYVVNVGDRTGCPPATSTVEVRNFTLAIAANSGPDFLRCITNTAIPLSGSITSASGGTWSAGAGTFVPSNAQLSPTYVPTPGEISAGSIQFILGTTGNQGCPPDEDTLVVTFQNQPTITASSDQTICANNNVSIHSAIISGYTATALWSAASGTFAPPTGVLTSFYPSAAQIAAGSATLIVGTTNNGACGPDSDTIVVHITPGPIVNAAADQTICSSSGATLAGSVSPSPFTGSWTTTGDGTFSNASSLNSGYTPGPTDISTGSVQLVLNSANNGNCNVERDTMRLTIVRIATVSVSAPTLVCSTTTLVSVNATVTGAAGTGSWTSSGTGFFANGNNLSTSYQLSAADAGQTQLIFAITSTSNGPCPAQTSSAIMTLAPTPTVNAGVNLAICSSQPTFVLGSGQPTITGTTNSGAWSTGGTGSFAGTGNYQTETYSVTAGDIAAGTIIFTLTSTNNGVCAARSDTVRLRIINSPTVMAGANSPVCSSAGTIVLNGIVAGGINNSGIWTSTGTGTFNPGSTSLSNAYQFSPLDIAGGFVIFTLTSTNNGPCAAVADSVRINIFHFATVTPGPSQVICSTQGSIALSSTVQSTPNTGTWSAFGGGSYFPANSAVTGYSLTSTDILAGNITFTITSTNNGPCPPVSATTQVQIVQQPTVLASATPSVCSSSPTAALSATVLGTSGTASWTSSGDGSFPGGPSALNGSYVGGPGDISSGIVTLSLSSTNFTPCAFTQATTSVLIQAAPQATVDGNQLICSIQQTVALNGTVTGVSNSGTWTASGAGQFLPTNTTTTSYSLTQADINGGTVTFTLTSTNNGACPAATSTLLVQVTKQPTVIASVSQSICSSSGSAAISGTVLGGTGSGIWASAGSGSFVPSNSSLNTSYLISANDIANGSVLLTLSSSNSSPCPVPLDSLRLFIQIPPQVTAGSDQLICSNQALVALAGTVLSSFNTGTWSASGTGIFTPTNSAVTNYSITPSDITNGSVIFTLTSTQNGGCNPATSTMSVQIGREATVVASPAQTLCSTSASAVINGTVSGGSGTAIWSSSGSGGFSTANTNLSNAYLFTQNDISTGTVALVLSSTNNSPCPVASDSVMIYVQSPSTVNTGSYSPVCSGNSTFALAGIVSGGQETGVWTSTGGGTLLPSGNDLNATYVLGPNEILYGLVTLTLTSTNNGACAPTSQTVAVSVIQQVSVLAAADATVCSDQVQVPINGTVSGNSAGTLWSTNGAGTITAPALLNTSYNLVAGDIAAGKVFVILTSPPNGPCAAVVDSMAINITKKPVITLQSDTTICSKQNPLQLHSNINDGSGTVLWVTSGSGTFQPNNFVANAAYVMSPADISTGTVQLSVNSLSNGACGNISSVMFVDIKPSPKASFSASEYTVTIPANPVTFTNQTLNGDRFQWEVSDGTKDSTFNFTKQFTSVGYYTVTLYAGNTYGCQDTTEQTITVISAVKAPTAFSPNGDRLNDEFRIYTEGVVEYEMMIFNRWGEMIFRSETMNHGWDGSFKGKGCQQDVYVWKAKIKFFDGRDYEGTGSITLIR